MLVILIGKAASGKTTIQKKLEDRGFKRHITYTTRPPRNGEEDHVTYHFISPQEFQQKISEDFFTEYKSYDTAKGRWWYGSKLTELGDQDEVIILTPAGFRDVKDKLGDEVLSIYIFANNKTIKSRLASRGDRKNEAERRFQHDIIDFKGIENEVDKIVYNNQYDDLDTVVDKIIGIVDKYKRKKTR